MFVGSVVVEGDDDDGASFRKEFTWVGTLFGVTCHPTHLAVVAARKPFAKPITLRTQLRSRSNPHQVKPDVARVLSNLIT